jgi:hypothetical protein
MCGKRILAFAFCFFTIVSCKKEDKIVEEPEPQIPVQNIQLKISYRVDAAALLFDSMQYFTKAGYQFSVSRLVYFLSQIRLVKLDSSTVLLKNYHYVDAAKPEENEISFSKIPEGEYIGLALNVGLDSLQNNPDLLAVSDEINNMVWPVPMGGGFHFLKLEGYFKDNAVNYGYAMHIGTNPCLVPIKLFKAISVKNDSQFTLNLTMNVNEWFQNPLTFDFNADGNNTMGNLPLMKKIALNGRDVFSF